MRFDLKVLAASAVITTSVISSAYAQPTTPDPNRPGGGAPAAGNAARPAANNKPKPYSEVITGKAKSDDGFFKVHQIEDTYFFEIPDAMFGREILLVNRISKSGIGNQSSYAGDQYGQTVVRFDKGPNDKVFLRKISYAVYAKDSTSQMFQNVQNSNVQPIIQAFDVKSSATASNGTVIDVTDLISNDNEVLFFSANAKRSQGLGAFQKDKSYPVAVKSFPTNIEIRTVKTYAGAAAATTPGAPSGGAPGGGGSTDNKTLELNSSLVLLPEVPMQARHFDARVGYFTVGYTDFDKNPQGVDRVSMVKRWRLEPKDADIEKYKRGELVEPKKPIIFYIDPTTPKKWIPYLIQGVNDWQVAFEKAGFKNAIIGKVAPTPEQDPEWSLEDARHSAIVYKPSDVANASGPSISDPRSGEILESHINWYHNVMSLLRNWYFIQAAPNDPRARTLDMEDSLMGELIRFVSSHEVGHTIGLRHNHGSSSTVPTDSLRSNKWLKENGHTPSIMDYARFNYVAQPEDKVDIETGIFPRIGIYDQWAIEWGYRWFPEYKTPEAEKSHLNKWVIEKLKDKRLWFGTESNPDDPRSQSEQVGDDAMKSSGYGIKNLQRIVPNLLTWTRKANEDYTNLNELYGQVVSQFSRYMGHVAKYIGGIEETPKTVEQAGPIYEFTSKADQKRAVDFLNKELFNTPTWLINNEIFGYTGGKPLSIIGGVQDNILSRIVATRNLSKFADAEAALGNNAYKMTDLFADLKKGIWSEAASRKPVDIYRRNLQKSYVTTFIKIIEPAAPTAAATGAVGGSANLDKSDIKSNVRAHLAALRTELTAAAAGTADVATKNHYQDIIKRIDNALNPK